MIQQFPFCRSLDDRKKSVLSLLTLSSERGEFKANETSCCSKCFARRDIGWLVYLLLLNWLILNKRFIGLMGGYTLQDGISLPESALDVGAAP